MDCSVWRIGFNDKKYPSYDGDSLLKEYEIWKSMLKRCTEKEWLRHPTYTGATCSDNFKSYSFFYEWCNRQVGFNSRDEKGVRWCLDKDILVRGNKLYSENTCVFVPQRINKLLVKHLARRGDYPIGVVYNPKHGKFSAKCKNGFGETKGLGTYGTKEEAFKAYKMYKECLIKQTAGEYKEQLDDKVYQALLSYEVDYSD